MEVWDRLQSSPGLSTDNEGKELLNTGKYAYISNKGYMEYHAAKSCGVYSIATASYNTAWEAFVIPQGAPYARIINYQ